MKLKKPRKIYCLYRKIPTATGFTALFVEGFLKPDFEQFKKDNPEWEKDYVVREF